MRVKMQYRPMGGAVGATVAKLLGQAPENRSSSTSINSNRSWRPARLRAPKGSPPGEPEHVEKV